MIQCRPMMKPFILARRGAGEEAESEQAGLRAGVPATVAIVVVDAAKLLGRPAARLATAAAETRPSPPPGRLRGGFDQPNAA